MLRRRQGRIVNVTSIGGKVPVPHLLPLDRDRPGGAEQERLVVRGLREHRHDDLVPDTWSRGEEQESTKDPGAMGGHWLHSCPTD